MNSKATLALIASNFEIAICRNVMWKYNNDNNNVSKLLMLKKCTDLSKYSVTALKFSFYMPWDAANSNTWK